MDPGSRPESQRVTSCANRLVVTPEAYREDVEGAYVDPGSSAYRDDVEGAYRDDVEGAYRDDEEGAGSLFLTTDLLSIPDRSATGFRGMVLATASSN